MLNKKYYRVIDDKFKNRKVIESVLEEPSSLLTLKIILDQIQQNKPIHFNFHNRKEMIYNIGYSLFVELANVIFCEFIDYPSFQIGSIVRYKKKIGFEKPKNYHFVIDNIVGNNYSLKCVSKGRDNLTLPNRKYDELVNDFIPVTQNVRDKTLKRFYEYFTQLNQKQLHDFEPTVFTKKCVFIAPKTFWDDLKVKSLLSR